MEKIILQFAIVVGLMFFIPPAFAVDYYVDFDNGSNNNNGTSASSPWKHAPGDSNATDNPATAILSAGDNLMFKGGVVYRGTINLFHSGQSSSPISYYGNRWGTERAIIDGGAILGGWQRCSSSAECGDNPNWSNIYYTYLPEDINAFIANLHEKSSSTGEEEFLWISQYPNPSDPYFFDNHLEFMTVSNANISRTTITDPSFFTQTDPSYWENSYIQAWVNPNRISIRAIDSFDPLTDTISFEDLGIYAIYPDGRDQSYSIYNSIHAIDYAGEFSVNLEIEAGLGRKIYLWPQEEADLNQRISYSERKYAFDIRDSNHLTIEGFDMRKHSGESIREGGAITTNYSSASDNHGITIRDNYIYHNKQVSNSYGLIFLSNAYDSLIEDNIIEDNPKHKGIFLSSPENSIIKGNKIIRPGNTALSSYTALNLQILNNTIRESRGSHANGITLYIGCKDVLVAGNVVLDSVTPLTFQDSGNLWFVNNVFDGNNEGNNVNEWGDTSHGPWQRGTIAFLNNTLMRNNRNASLNIGSKHGIIFESDFSEIIGVESERLTLLLDLYNRGYIEDGVVQDAFRSLSNLNDFQLGAQFLGYKEGIYDRLKKAEVKNDYLVINNIIDGGGRVNFRVYDENVGEYKYISHPHFESHYNIYTGLSWQQSASYDWSLNPSEFIEEIDSSICKDPGNVDFHLLSDSPAVDSGTDIAPYLDEVSAIFPEFNFYQDVEGNSRPGGAIFDIGAYEYRALYRSDVDNSSEITTTDALLTLRNSLGLSMTGTAWQASSTTGDVNCNGVSNSTDALLILRYSLGLSMDATGWCE